VLIVFHLLSAGGVSGSALRVLSNAAVWDRKCSHQHQDTSVCVCVCEKEREREKERNSECVRESERASTRVRLSV